MARYQNVIDVVDALNGVIEVLEQLIVEVCRENLLLRGGLLVREVAVDAVGEGEVAPKGIVHGRVDLRGQGLVHQLQHLEVVHVLAGQLSVESLPVDAHELAQPFLTWAS